MTLLRQGALAGHDADVFAVAPGGQGLAPGDSLAIAEGGHAVDGIDEGAVVAQQNMAHALLVEGGQVELGSSLSCPGGGFTHDGLISVFG
jgi:hypothetical protein